MKKALLLTLSLLLVPAYSWAVHAILTTPRSLGTVGEVDVQAVILLFTYDPITNDYILAEIKISAIEGDIMEEGITPDPDALPVILGEHFETRSGEAYVIPLADIPAAMTTAATTLKTEAVNDYVTREGYTVNP